jgi:hypothetical protein
MKLYLIHQISFRQEWNETFGQYSLISGIHIFGNGFQDTFETCEYGMSDKVKSVDADEEIRQIYFTLCWMPRITPAMWKTPINTIRRNWMQVKLTWMKDNL